MMLLASAQSWVLSLAATAPTPGEELPFNPDDVTPGPLGFFVFIFVAVATGLLVMDLIRRTSRVQARARIREQLQAEMAAKEGTVSEGTESPQLGQEPEEQAAPEHREPDHEPPAAKP
uniref:hypothetical protein n=1 Tax=Pseudoclavibacter sp. RFBI5 TaxID=2080578 RepID=UPI0015E359B1|nr:hypothetical protein [Pseudoclavibacter sp. RFBI5]